MLANNKQTITFFTQLMPRVDLELELQAEPEGEEEDQGEEVVVVVVGEADRQQLSVPPVLGAWQDIR